MLLQAQESMKAKPVHLSGAGVCGSKLTATAWCCAEHPASGAGSVEEFFFKNKDQERLLFITDLGSSSQIQAKMHVVTLIGIEPWGIILPAK